MRRTFVAVDFRDLYHISSSCAAAIGAIRQLDAKNIRLVFWSGTTEGSKGPRVTGPFVSMFDAEKDEELCDSVELLRLDGLGMEDAVKLYCTTIVTLLVTGGVIIPYPHRRPMLKYNYLPPITSNGTTRLPAGRKHQGEMSIELA